MKGSTKDSIRTELISLRAQIPAKVLAKKNQMIIEVLSNWLAQNTWKEVLAFRSFRNEPDLDLLLKSLAGSRTYLPVMNPQLRTMNFHPWKHGEALEQNKYGIEEPKPDDSGSAKPNREAIIIVPCVACAPDGTRLGYGGGYYDRYLDRYPDAKSIGVVFSEYLVEGLPSEAHDRKLDYIATEHSVTRRVVNNQA